MLCLGSTAFAVAEPAPPPTARLSLQAALDAGQARSAALQAQDAAAQAAREMAVAAGRLPDPQLGLSVDNLPIEGDSRYSLTSEPMTMRSVSLKQTFTGASKREARAARYTRQAESAVSMRHREEATLRTQIARAWFERYFQEKALELLQRQREETMRLIEAVEAAYRGGRGSQADVLLARAALARTDDRLHAARADLAKAQARLTRWVGTVGTGPLGAPPDVAHSRLSLRRMGEAMDRHPDIALMNAGERVALAEAEVARQEKSADWTWSLKYSKRGSRYGDMVSVGVSIPLQWDQSQRQDRELAAKLAQVEQVRSEREEMRRERRYEVERLFTDWRSTLDRLTDYDKTLIPLTTERVQASEAAFRGGTAALSAVLEARRVVVDTRLERLRIAQQSAQWWAELEFLVAPDSQHRLAQASTSVQALAEQQP